MNNKINAIFLISQNNFSFIHSYISKTFMHQISQNFINNICKVLSKREKIEKSSKISIEQIKIKKHLIIYISIFKQNFYFVCLLNKEASVPICKMKILHLYISFLNYLNVICDKDKDISLSHLSISYLNFFVQPLESNFDEIFSLISQNQNLYVGNLIYKNSLLINLDNNTILCDFSNISKKSKYFNLHQNEKLWTEILYHSTNLRNEYIDEYQNISFDPQYYSKYFIKLECKATYPRLIIVIKFIPVLRGLSLVHIYLHNKLSRGGGNTGNDVARCSTKVSANSLNNCSTMTKTMYKEFDVVYGTEIGKIDNHFEFKFTESLLIKRIEHFIVDYYILLTSTNSFVSNWKYFHVDNYPLKYINDIFISPILHSRGNEKKIQQMFYEMYLKSEKEKKEKEQNNNTKYNKKKRDNEITATNYLDILHLKKETFLNFFNMKPVLSTNNSIISNSNEDSKSGSQLLEKEIITKSDKDMSNTVIVNNDSDRQQNSKDLFSLDITDITMKNEEDNISAVGVGFINAMKREKKKRNPFEDNNNEPSISLSEISKVNPKDVNGQRSCREKNNNNNIYSNSPNKDEVKKQNGSWSVPCVQNDKDNINYFIQIE